MADQDAALNGLPEALALGRSLLEAGLLSEHDVALAGMRGPRTWWGGRLDVEGLALGSVRLAAAALAKAAGEPGLLDSTSERVAASFNSLAQLRVDGKAPVGFAPLSRFWPVADGWLRTHANYPHHLSALGRALELGSDVSAQTVGAALARLTAAEAEHRITVAGGIASAVRSRIGWTASAAGIAAHPGGTQPLRVRLDGLDRLDRFEQVDSLELKGTDGAHGRNAGGRSSGGPGGREGFVGPGGNHGADAQDAGGHDVGGPRWQPGSAGRGDAPLAGLRVLELTRVIAGPTATRSLAALGADVVRIDDPRRPELEEMRLDTDAGKRLLPWDLRERAEEVHALLAQAHVCVTGFRPGAMEAFGLSDEDLAGRHPHLIRASLSAWGPGPREGERGFDSIVQAACGIANEYRDEHGKAGALPVQALDHATGQLLAAGIGALLARRSQGGGGGAVSGALAHTAEALWTLPGVATVGSAVGAVNAGGQASADGPATVHGHTGANGTRALDLPAAQRWESSGRVIEAAPAALNVRGETAAPSSWDPWFAGAETPRWRDSSDS